MPATPHNSDSDDQIISMPRLLQGIAIAGILYGIGESLAAGYLGGSYREIIGFALVILALTLRPNGLFGKNQTKKV